MFDTVPEMNHSRILAIVLLLLVLAAAACSPPDVPTSSGISEESRSAMQVTVAQDGGLVALSAPGGLPIRYTADGTVPTAASSLYREPFPLERVHVLTDHADRITVGDCRILNGSVPVANVIRAAAVLPDGSLGPVTTRTCFAQTPELPAVSLVMDYDDLLDAETGILVRGSIYDAWADTAEGRRILQDGQYWKCKANYTQKGRDWERSALVEIIDGDDVLLTGAGVRIQGGSSRMFPQKSFNLYFREDYSGPLQADLFHNGVELHKSLTLRNGGNDTETLKFKDAWLQHMLAGLDFTTLASRPVLVYINGEYWGPYTLQEKYGSTFIREHYGAEEIVMIKEGELEEGSDYALYEDLIAFADRDLADPAVWAAFCDVMDVQSMADFFAAQIYIGNADWRPDKNIALWRSVPRGEGLCDGRWRFLLYDTEYSSALYGQDVTAAAFDHYAQAVQTFPLFAAAMRNPDFQALYRQSLETVRTRFAPEKVAASLEQYLAVWQPLMPDYYARFGDTSALYDPEAVTAFFASRYADLSPCLP